MFLGFILGVIVGVACYWYAVQPPARSRPVSAKANEPSSVTQAQRSDRESLDTSKIKDELKRTGRVVREKAVQAGAALGDAAVNARITASIKAKLVKEAGLDTLKIHVSTTDGVVTLSGKADNYDEVAKAVGLALQTDGVQKVVCTMQVAPPEAHESHG